MGLSAGERVHWYRIRLRMLDESKILEYLPGVLYRRLPWKTQFLLHRLVKLTWIGENELAEKLWEEEKNNHYFYDMSFEELLFRILILKRLSGYAHPEVPHPVHYLVLDEEDAFKVSTIPLSELLKMDKPHFSSADGLIEADFDKGELERISKITPKEYHTKLRLPLILLRKVDNDIGYYRFVGTKLENMLLQVLLKLTEEPFETLEEIEEKRELIKISMLRRRRFNTIYKILPETSSIYLSYFE